MKLSLGFSPCPNDTFIFDAMIHGKIDTEGLDFEVILGDVEELNQRAFAGELAITKLSFHAFAHLLDTYTLLDAGSALGRNCGPLLIAKQALDDQQINAGPIAIPGKYTTANFLLGLAYPAAKNKKEILFSDIEGAVLEEKVTAGLIIHENRFTYAQRGLCKLIDLGEYWESTTGMPIPLGGIVAQRSLAADTLEKVNRVMKRSVAYAFSHPKDSLPFIKKHAQEMDEEVMYAHIGLYVNEFTKDLGLEGKQAVQYLFDKAASLSQIPAVDKSIFLTPIEKLT